MNVPARSLAAVAALLGACALALQAGMTIQQLIDQGFTPLAAVWRFFGWFTILDNLLCVIVLTALTLKPDATTGLAGPRMMLAAAASIVLVGIVYSVALRNLRAPVDLEFLSDELLHDVMPVLFVIVWLTRPHVGLKWCDALWSLVLPGLYAAYALGRGAMEGWYAYWFLDPSRSSTLGLVRNIVVLLAAQLVIGLIFVGVDRVLARRRAAR